MRTEQQIFEALEELSRQDGFWEIIAFFCWKDTFIHFSGDKLDEKAFSGQFDRTRLSRTELSTLVGLACKHGFKATQLSFDELKCRAEDLWHLLDELHNSFYTTLDFSSLVAKVKQEDERATFSNKIFSDFIHSNEHNAFMREAIFYGGDGAYKHQYRDLAKRRYSYDDNWLQTNKGFSIIQAATVINAIDQIQLQKVNHAVSESRSWPLPYHLPVFMFEPSEITKQSGLDLKIVTAVIDAFSAQPEEGMDCFNSVDDFNHRNAFPLIKIDTDKYLSFQSYSLWESLYESPFFWFGADKKYNVIASSHRGVFTEEFAKERLALVFGEKNVLSNIDLFDGKNKIGEIDVLVTFGAYAIVVQAKSKKLTIEARKGNSSQLKKDFKLAIQDAYDQSLICSEALISGGLTLKDSSGTAIESIGTDFKAIFPICLVSDHFPALAAQASHFLDYKVTNTIKHPYVMDVFLLDMISEMLQSPLRFLDYMTKRSDFGDSIVSNHELVTLSTYILQNLYFDENPNMVMLGDDISGALELAMLARRDGFDGTKTPEGFLTAHKNTYVSGIIEDIENSSDYALQKLGFHLLSMCGKSIDLLNSAIAKLIEQFKKDYRHHDITLPLFDVKSGLTIHCSEDDHETAYKRLIVHCEKRKYICKANYWVGCCLSPAHGRLRFASYHESEWEQSSEMDKLVADLKPLHSITPTPRSSPKQSMRSGGKKIGRNAPCPCGSGKKHKHCCIV
ncbi:SEC-C metal-binding domain-containing protein [Rheinheimera sp. UJ63]|uniref:SEC-C metal-binding domain-containing protein n=1 Tax=Rheinheimera sp. UJ63 TaxID=2910157 RepID=UPI001F218CC8|nr:SEC-C metal-binding domain-containing protein [Rheinheimera sp. UJ63]MCF4009138.1 SEC-C domain-containing protein [Rheinheimera sp. UJ63]